jgi:hypothetical protein
MVTMIQKDEAVLGPLAPPLKTGEEPFHCDRQPVGTTLIDFWRWSMSDLVANTARGVLAEFIVAKALEARTDKPRKNWGSWDLVSRSGTQVEVKSAAYLQSWAQRRLSVIQFVVPKTREWDAATGQTEEVARRHATVYVFALLAHQDKATVDPLDLSQWRFWVVPTRLLDERTRSHHSITLSSLRDLAGEPVTFRQLADAVERAERSEG